MKRQGKGNREQGIGNRQQATDISVLVWLEEMLRQAVPKIDANTESAHDLWPMLAARIREAETRWAEPVVVRVPWYDWALAAGLLVFIGAAPVTLPVLLYYL